MALYAMPFLILNLGTEMVYILEQRLEAQSITADKSKKVLNDVVASMLSDDLIREVFKPQDMYLSTVTSAIRGVFERLAHSSIMRLSESSMEKLFDLMTMGLKYQVVSCKCPAELLDVSENHFNSLKSIGLEPAVYEKLDAFIQRFQELFFVMSDGQLNELRQALLRFFQDKKVKVSLFLQEQLQLSNGNFVLKPDGVLPPQISMPGVVLYFEPNGQYKGEQVFSYPVIMQPRTKDTPKTTLGTNIYKKKLPPSPSLAYPNPFSSSQNYDQEAEPDAPIKRDLLAKAELNLLSHLISVRKVADKDTLKVQNLFPDSWLTMSGSVISGDVTTIAIDASKSNRSKELQDIMNDFTIQEKKVDENEDLLDLVQ